MNLNKVIIVGRVVADPELRATPTGQSVSSFGIATNRIWTDKSGSQQKDTEFHNVVAWGRNAEIANQFLKKGSLVLIEGRLQTRTWDDKTTGQKRYRTEIVIERLQLGPRSSQAPGGQSGFAADETEQKTGALPEINVDEDNIKAEDIPF